MNLSLAEKVDVLERRVETLTRATEGGFMAEKDWFKNKEVAIREQGRLIKELTARIEQLESRQ